MIGLTEEQVLRSRKEHGSNKLPEPEMKKWYDFAKEALAEKITMILIAIAALQLVLAVLGVMELSEPVMIMFVLAIVTGIAIKTGLGVQKSAAELRAKSSIRYCDVIRDGKTSTINKNDIVVDDVLLVRTGDEIFADGYLVKGKIAVNNSAINGETKECKKTPVEGYIHVKTTSTDAYTNQNCLFAGTTVMSGEGTMIVTDVGVNTVNGDTLVKMQTLEAPRTALDIALDNLSSFITKWGTAAAIVTFIILLASGIMEVGFDTYFSGGAVSLIQKIASNFSVALSIIIAAVPEGLPMIVQLVTKQNVNIMEKSNILAKNPGKIPELAYVDLICTDKTGTLTTGIMSPKSVLDGIGGDISKEDEIWNRIRINISVNNSATFDGDGNITGGNSIDRAVLSMTTANEYESITASVKMKDKQVFSSSNKYSAFTDSSDVTYYKGAPERIIDVCTKMHMKNSEIREMSKEDIQSLKESIRVLTTRSMRCIALAEKNEPLEENELPNDMIFTAIIGVVDPVREEVPYAVKKAYEAGIQVIEITGDCIETAVAVAEECGIYKEGDVALANDEFEVMTDEQIKEIIPSLRVISRCSPNTKLRLVTLAQEIGRAVAMTGDGVNDSPALKRADVGFGMQGGSDVAKEASDIILTDDNFASVVKAVELGRTFMHNIMMFLEFQLPINISLLILSVIYPIVAVGSFLASVQILIVNIIMDSLNSLSFGAEPSKEEYMTEKPIQKGAGLFIRGAKARIAISAAAFIVLYGVMILSPVSKMFANEAQAMTARFAMLCFMAVFNGFCIRTESLNLFKGLSKNMLFGEIAVGIFAMTVILCTFAGSLIKVVALSPIQWGIIVVLAVMVVLIDAVRKLVTK